MDDRSAFPDAVHPDARLIDRVMKPDPHGFAHVADGVCGIGLKCEGDLVIIHKMEEPNIAAGERLGLVDRGA